MIKPFQQSLLVVVVIPHRAPAEPGEAAFWDVPAMTAVDARRQKVEIEPGPEILLQVAVVWSGVHKLPPNQKNGDVVVDPELIHHQLEVPDRKEHQEKEK